MALTPSQRVTLMKEISQRLGAENWSLIDATLNQFALPTTDSWVGESTAYVLKMLQKAKDGVLIDLARHVGYQFELETAAVRVDPPFWRKGMLRLFITHLAAHKVFAAQLQEELFRYGISKFVATMTSSQRWNGRHRSRPHSRPATRSLRCCMTTFNRVSGPTRR